jgi:hypothetical protein
MSLRCRPPGLVFSHGEVPEPVRRQRRSVLVIDRWPSQTWIARARHLSLGWVQRFAYPRD